MPTVVEPAVALQALPPMVSARSLMGLDPAGTVMVAEAPVTLLSGMATAPPAY